MRSKELMQRIKEIDPAFALLVAGTGCLAVGMAGSLIDDGGRSLVRAEGGLVAGVGSIPATNPGNRASNDANQVTKDIANGKPVSVLENGRASIKLSDGRFVRISNPILAEDGGVMERARKDSRVASAVIAYIANSSSTDVLQKITYTEHGNEVSQQRAYADTTPIVITPSGDITRGTHLNYFVAAPGQSFSGEPIAQGTPEQYGHGDKSHIQ